MILMNKNTWVMIANGSKCKIFLVTCKKKRLKLLKEFYYTETRSHGVSLNVARPDLVYESINSMRHRVEPKTNPHRKAKDKFAHLLASFLNIEANAKKFNKLILIAPAEFLGIIRKQLHKSVSALILTEENKDLTHFTEEKILKFISSH